MGKVGGYEADTALVMDDELAECRTRLTSRCASGDHRSTVST